MTGDNAPAAPLDAADGETKIRKFNINFGPQHTVGGRVLRAEVDIEAADLSFAALANAGFGGVQGVHAEALIVHVQLPFPGSAAFSSPGSGFTPRSMPSQGDRKSQLRHSTDFTGS